VSPTVCERHSDTETELRCQRCDTPICLRCMVQTPVGFRCPECAMLRRPPMYELAVGHYLCAVGVALPLGALLGVAGGLLLAPTPRASIFVLVLALLGGAGAGRVLGAAISRATNGKRGSGMQVAAVVALVVAGLVRLAVSGDIDLLTRELTGLVAVGAGIVVAWDRLR
jgi:hypothetical protein